MGSFVHAVVVAVALTSVALTISSGFKADHQVPAPRTDATRHPVATGPAEPIRATCPRPAPTTAKGYAAMFATVDVREFGAADVGLSVPLEEGRSVWLFGDTFSTGRFVHSSAIVRDGGCLHISRGGAQLLPDDDANHIYWVQSATATGSTLRVKARSVVLTGKGSWDFRDGGFSRAATVKVDTRGDLTFLRWGQREVSPAPDPGSMVMLGDHHFGYSVQAHPEAQLASGKTLTSMAQNFDDGRMRPVEAYRLIFTEK